MAEEIVKKGPGRPIKFGNDHPCWDILFEQMSEGKSLTSALKRPGMPTFGGAMKVLRNNPEIRARYDKACEDRADKLAEEIIELSDEEMPEGLTGPMASAWVQKKRMQVDARKWVASKLYSRRYGERVDVSVTDTRISVMDALKEAKQRVLRDDSNVIDVAVKVDVSEVVEIGNNDRSDEV